MASITPTKPNRFSIAVTKTSIAVTKTSIAIKRPA